MWRCDRARLGALGVVVERRKSSSVVVLPIVPGLDVHAQLDVRRRRWL
jgi:hypothetical protein